MKLEIKKNTYDKIIVVMVSFFLLLVYNNSVLRGNIYVNRISNYSNYLIFDD